MQLQNMNYDNVTLWDGPCMRQVEQVIDFLLSLDEDRMLHTFRKGAGLPAPSQTYYGWYGQGATTLGQWIGAMAKLYCATGDRRLKEKMVRSLEEWQKCIIETGYTNFSAEHSSTYGFEKMAGGLVDAYAYASYAPAMDLLERITCWAEKTFDQNIAQEYIPYNALAQKGMHEWYTLSENYYRAYAVSGRQHFFCFAQKWDYMAFWKDMASGKENLPPLHAYSHINSLCGAAWKYLLTGEDFYCQAVTEAYKVMTNKHIFATGGYGPAEALFGKPGYLGNSLLSSREKDLMGEHLFEDLEGFSTCDDQWGSCEVSCCAWAVFKLTSYLLQMTGDARYAEWAEKMIINGVLAQMPLTKEGKVEYYANYFCHGARKEVEDRRIGPSGNANIWQCCTGTFPQAVAAYHELIYYYTDHVLCVAQYIPSQGTFSLQDGRVTLEIHGAFPMAQQYRIVVRPAYAGQYFSLRLRIPSWATGAEVWRNQASVSERPVPGQWLEISRCWEEKEEIELRLPFHLHWQPVDAQHPNIMALLWGPLVLVSDELMRLKGDASRPEKWIVPRDAAQGVFETVPGHDQAFSTRTHVFRPFYAVGENQWYYMYIQFVRE